MLSDEDIDNEIAILREQPNFADWYARNRFRLLLKSGDRLIRKLVLACEGYRTKNKSLLELQLPLLEGASF